MKSRLKKLILEIEKALNHDNFIELSEDIISKIEKLPNAFEAVEPILRILEKNKEVDFGMPGPLVHFVESFYGNGYESKLLESLNRDATEHTLWMLNRVINGSKGEMKKKLLDELNNISKQENLSKNIRNCAESFYKFQSKDD